MLTAPLATRYWIPKRSRSKSDDCAQFLGGLRCLLLYPIYHSCADLHKRIMVYATYWASTTSHKGKIGAHQGHPSVGRPPWYVQRNMVVPFVSSALTRKNLRRGGRNGDLMKRCENPAAFPILSEVLTSEIGDPGSTVGCDLWREATNWVTRSITCVSNLLR